MNLKWPFLWPAEWRQAGALDVLRGAPAGLLALLLPPGEGYGEVAERAGQMGIAVCESGHAPSGVEMVKGEWPGIRMTPGEGDAASGPTGAPWIDSNGWLVRLMRARKPGATVWVTADAPKGNEIVPISRHLVALADAAAHGGRWVITLDKDMAEGLAAGRPKAMEGWKKTMEAAAFFQVHSDWSGWPADAVLAVVSSFSGENEFFSHELLNLMARTNITYGIVPADGFEARALAGLRAAVYADAQAAPAEVRQGLSDFVERGGLLIAGPGWGPLGSPVSGEEHAGYQMRRWGKGRIATAREQPADPYELAQDAQILLSHRYDRVRLYNGFLLGAYATVSPDGKRRLAHIVNYGGGVDDDPATVHVARRFRAAKLWSWEGVVERLKLVAAGEGVDVHLPGLAVYGGIELEA